MDALADYSSDNPGSSSASEGADIRDEVAQAEVQQPDQPPDAEEGAQAVNLVFRHALSASSSSTGSSDSSEGTECFDVASSQGSKRARLSEPAAGNQASNQADAGWEPPVVMSSHQLHALQQLISAVQQLLPDLHSMLPGPSTSPEHAPHPADGIDPSSSSTPSHQLQHPPTRTHPNPAPSSTSAGPSRPQAQPTAREANHLTLPAPIPPSVPANTSMTPNLGLHISLSRAMPVRYAVVDTLIGQLKDALQPVARPFTLVLEGAQCFVNDEGTRTFLSIPVKQSKTKVCQLIRAVDQALRVYQLQEYYQDPQPHVSIAWVLGSRRDEVEQALAAVSEGHKDQGCHQAATGQQGPGQQGAGLPEPQSHDVTCVLCRIGNRDHLLWSGKSED